MSQQVATTRQRPNIVAGAPVAAIVPQSLDDAFRLSQALAVSGMAPRGMDKPEQIMVAIMAGAELGLAPFQSLQSFAVVNGRPTLWGDGLIAVVRARGVRVKEWVEGEGETLSAHCVATRPDTGEEIARTFTVADAKKASLWNKQGPWQQYPKRMLQMRARALALRDGCADMLRGIQVREEVEDYQPIREVTPQPAGIMARLPGANTGDGFSASNVDVLDHPADEIDRTLDGDNIPEFTSDGGFSPQTPAAVEGQQPEAEHGSASVDSPAAGSPSKAPDPIEWAAWAGREIDKFETVASLDGFSSMADVVDNFERLSQHSPNLAKTLEAQLNGKRKALQARERG